MKLLWVIPECPYPPNTGGRMVMWKRIQYLSENNEIHLYSIYDNENDLCGKEIIEQCCSLVRLYSRNGKISSLIKSTIFPYPAVSRWNSRMKKDIEDDYNNFEPDLVMVDFPQMLGGLPKNVLKSGRIVLNQHNIEHKALYSLSQGLRGVKKTIYRIVAKQMEKYENKVYKDILLYSFVSDVDMNWFMNRYGLKNTMLVPIGAEIAEYKNEFSNQTDIVFVAKMSYPANEEGALWLIQDVLPIIRNKVPDIRLYIVGKDPSEVVLDYGRQDDRVIVTGTVDDVEPYYNKCIIAAIPIKTGGGVNVKLLEALGRNRFVVTTSKGIEGTAFKDGIHLFVEDDPVQFADRCIDIIQNYNKYEYIRRNSYDFMIKNYSWKTIVSCFEMKLREHVGESGDR